MKQRTSFVNRGIALVLALMLLVSQANMGIMLHAHAANNDESTAIAQIIADNYDLTEAEKNLLKSGYLVSDSFAYNVPSNEDSLVSVDTENAKITAEGKDGWVPTKAVITYGGKELEVPMTNGVGTYDAAVVGNAFSVKVIYELYTTVSAAKQEALLGAAAMLKQGLKNLADVAAQSGNLYILEQAMPELVNLAENGYQTSFAAATMTEAFINATKALNEQMTANGGKLNVSTMIEAYELTSKTGYLMTNGTKMQSEVAILVENVGVLATELGVVNNNMEYMLQQGWVSADLANQIKVLTNSCKKLHEGLTVVNGDDWAAANSTGLIADGTDFAKLDELVAALGETTAVTVKENLKVAETTLQVNMAMWNVTYKVVLNHIVNNESAVAFSAEKVETLADGASAEAVLALAQELVEQLKASKAYVEGKFDRTMTEVPAELGADLVLEITYNPKNFDVTIAGETKAYPYGYQLTLPVHEDAQKSYDYTDANGKYYAQGTVVTVEDTMTFTREEGKSYTNGNLFAIIADNFAGENQKVIDILNSGALKGNVAINYREPSKAELEELVKLEGNTLTVQTYASSYAGLNWAPYSYVVDGTENLFNGASVVTLPADFTNVSVYYRLTLTNFSKADVQGIMEMVAELAAQAEGQKSVMDRLAGYKDQMSQLNKNMLNGLIGMIGGYAKSEGGKFDDALVAQMKATIQDIIANCCAADGSLKINGIIDGYNDPNNGGLTYYYQNAADVKGQIEYLSVKLKALLGDAQGKELIATLLNDMNYGDYVAKLDDLNAKIAEINADLAPVDSRIDTTNAAKLSALAKALAAEGQITFAEAACPYIEMGPVNRVADKYVAVEVKVIVNGKSATFTTDAILKGTALTQAQVNALKAQIAAFVGQVDTRFFNNDYNNGAELNALVGKALDKSTDFEYTWTAKEYTVKIEGEKDQTVSINDLTINLPVHPNAEFGLSYVYTIGDKTANSGIFTFEAEDLLNLFKNGVLTITRVELNANVEALEKMVSNINIEMGFKALKLVSTNGVYTGIEANISAADLMDLMMGLVMKSGYSYIGLNGEGFIYSTADGLELSIQTLINAVFNDETFSNKTFIALGENGKGKLVSASMQLGNAADDIAYGDLTFTLNLNSVPQQLVDYVGYIKLITNYITFHADNGAMAFELNLPDQAYAAYAAALVATGNVAKTDINGMTQKVPVQFLYDYLTAITGSEMDLVTYSNTLEMLGINKSLAEYNKYYTGAMDAYNKAVKVTIDDDKTSVGLTAPGQKTINALLSLLNINTGSIGQFLPMLKEYKSGNNIVINATGKLVNVDKTYYALVMDLQAAGLSNKVEAPSSYASLAKETKELAGYSAIILTADVPGDLTVAGTTVLDLNGFKVGGTINATGKLIIIDTCLGNNTAGGAVNVTGNATILAGNYDSDVSSKLLAGCYLENGNVRNAMYRVEEDENGNLTFVLDGNFFNEMKTAGFLPDAKALAVNIATDLLLNYYNTAKIAIGGYELVAMDIDDLVGLYAGDDRITRLAKTLLGCFTIGEEGYENNAGFEGVVNMIAADLLDFEAITNALNNNTALFNYTLTTAPWTIEIDHNEAKDYATLDVRYNAKLEKTINVSLVVDTKYNDNVSAMTEVLSEIVVKDETFAMVDLPNPTYSDKTLTVSGAGKASLVMDMSGDNKYAVAIGVMLAYGNPAKAEAVAAAVNADDMAALKKVVDNTSVKEIFTALKKMARNVSFADMAAKVGITVSTADAAELEAKFHLVFCAAGKVLEELDITGMDSKLGALYNAETGYYELSKKDIFRDKELNVRSYSALVEVELTELTLKVKLFGEQPSEPDCMWGDANHDNIVDSDDATLVELYAVGKAPEIFCTIRTDVNGDGLIDTDDAALIRMYTVGSITVFPAENK